ncbi:thioesterase-like superfamily-domain-containing protein [Bisporella sp. PMI_857]|nr:thioesterase-like superfamily-domain-containing protein [Bisporella sp. PMI_857]
MSNSRSPFEQQLRLEKVPNQIEKYVKNPPHWAPGNRPVMGSMLLAQSMKAAYSTIPSDFQIHHISTQFFHAGNGKLSLAFEVVRTTDGKNNAGRIVHVSQEQKPICMMTMSFIRKPLLDGLSLKYQNVIPKIEEPDDEINDMKFLSMGILSAQHMARKIKPEATNFEEHKSYAYIKVSGISDPAGAVNHHCGLAAASDIFFLDAGARLHNLQIGLGEAQITESYTPWDFRSTVNAARPWIQGPKSDLAAMVSLNHTIYFHDLAKFRADDWILMEARTSAAYGGRVLVDSKLWSRDGVLVASCTAEGYYRLTKEGASKVSKSRL